MPDASWKEERLHGDEFIAFLEDKLDLERFGFRQTYSEYPGYERATRVIYNSDSCRVKFVLYNVGHFLWEDELSVQYGRLHAPDTEPYMMWNGERCRCWHYAIYLPVLFLEGYTAQEVASRREQEGTMPLPPVLESQEESDEDRKLRETYPPAAVVSREALIWDHYGARFFELFDLRRPDIWESYQHFVEEFYRLHPLPSIPGDTRPPHHKVC